MILCQLRQIQGNFIPWWGGGIKGKMGSIVGENDFCVFSKTDSLQKCVIVGGKRKKHSKSPNFVQLKTHQRMCSDDENQFQTRLAHVCKNIFSVLFKGKNWNHSRHIKFKL